MPIHMHGQEWRRTPPPQPFRPPRPPLEAPQPVRPEPSPDLLYTLDAIAVCRALTKRRTKHMVPGGGLLIQPNPVTPDGIEWLQRAIARLRESRDRYFIPVRSASGRLDPSWPIDTPAQDAAVTGTGDGRAKEAPDAQQENDLMLLRQDKVRAGRGRRKPRRRRARTARHG